MTQPSDQPDAYRTPSDVPHTESEIALWDNVFALNAARRIFDDNNKVWACGWADYAVEQRRARFGRR